MTDRLLTTREVCEILKCSRDTLLDLRRRGYIRAYIHPVWGGPPYVNRYKESEVQAYLENKLLEVREC